MLTDNDVQASLPRLEVPGKQIGLKEYRRALSDFGGSKSYSLWTSKSAPPKVGVAYEEDVARPSLGGVDDSVRRLAPGRMGTKWEYYSGTPLSQGPHSPLDRQDSGDSAQGPPLHWTPDNQMLPAAKSLTSTPSTGSNYSRSSQAGLKRKRSLPGTPDPSAEVIALSPNALLATNRFVCEICNKGFQRDQNLQLHRRGHNVPWKLRARPPSNSSGKRVYVCPEPTCVHHDPRRALGDLTGIKKHYSRKHGEKRWKCDKCGKKYAVEADWKAHLKICGPKQYTCECGDIFNRRETFATHRACCPHGSSPMQSQLRSQPSAFAPVSGAHTFPSRQLPSETNPNGRAAPPRTAPPPRSLFPSSPNPSALAHIGQSHDGTPLLISVPASASGARQPGTMADVNLAARRGLERREPLQLLPLSGSMWDQRTMTPPPASSGPLQPAVSLWLGTRPAAVRPAQPLQPLAIPAKVGEVKVEAGGNGIGETGQSQGGTPSQPPSPLNLGGANLGYSETFHNVSPGEQSAVNAPQTILTATVRASSPLLQAMQTSPRPQLASDPQGGEAPNAAVSMGGGDSQAALPSAAAAAAAVAAANAGHQVTISIETPQYEMNTAQVLTLNSELPSPREQAHSAEGGGFKVLEQPQVMLALSSSTTPLVGVRTSIPALIHMPTPAHAGGEMPGMMEHQGQGASLLISTQVGGGGQTAQMTPPGSPMLVGPGQGVSHQEEVLWAKVSAEEQNAQHAAQQAQAQAQQVIQQQMQQQQQQQQAQQQAQQQGLQMAMHQAGIQLAVHQAQMGVHVDMQQTIHMGVSQGLAVPVQELQPSMATQQQLAAAQQHEELQHMAARQEMIAQAQEAQAAEQQQQQDLHLTVQQAQQQGLLNLGGVTLQAAVPTLPQLSSGLTLHLPPPEELALHHTQQPTEELQAMMPLPSPRSLLAALPSGSVNTSSQQGGLDEGKKTADLMQEAISAAARGSTQKLNELIEQEAQKQQQQQALAMVQAAEQHELQQQHEANQAQLQAHHQAQQVELSQMHAVGTVGQVLGARPGVLLDDGVSQEGRPSAFVEAQSFGAAQGGPFFTSFPPPLGMATLLSSENAAPAGGMASQVVVSSLPGGQLNSNELKRAQISPQGGEQLLRSLSRQQLNELAGVGLGAPLDVVTGVNNVGGQLVMLQGVNEGAMHAERGHQDVTAANQQSVEGLYSEPTSLAQAVLARHSLGHASEHPNS